MEILRSRSSRGEIGMRDMGEGLRDVAKALKDIARELREIRKVLTEEAGDGMDRDGR